MKTTKEQRAELRTRTPTSPQAMYQLYVRRAELHAVLDDLDEAEARAERYETKLRSIADGDIDLALVVGYARDALAETAPKTPARLDPDGTAQGKTILTGRVRSSSSGDGTNWAEPGSAHIDTETGKRTELLHGPGTSSPDDAELCTCELGKPCYDDTSKCDCGCPHHDNATWSLSPDDAERAARGMAVPMTDEQIDRKARDIIANITHEPNTKGTCMTVAFESMYAVLVEYERLLRTRDAQAREAGRVEAIEDVVAGFKAKVEAGYDVPPYVFAELTNALDSLNRPDRAK